MDKVLDLIDNEKLFKNCKKVGVAVSGGIDSMVLLHFLNSIKTKLNINIIALHFDHRIRKNSSKDKEFVQAYCNENKIEFHSTNGDVLQYCKLNKKGIEEGARELRYLFFNECLRLGIVDVIALAHHMNDQTETIFLNILRGAGLDGLSGMKVKNGKYVRPFLSISKSEILTYANDNNISYVQDETNFNSNYSRNFLRNEIFPILVQKFNNVEEVLCRVAQNVSSDNDFINSTIDFSCVLECGDCIKIPKIVLMNYHQSQQYRLIKYALSLKNQEKDFSQIKFGNILSLLHSKNGAQIFLKQNLIAVNDYEYLTLELNSVNIKEKFQPITLNKKDLYNFKLFDYQFEVSDNISICKDAIHILDYNKLPQVIQIRTRANGDIFAKFGTGKKKLKEYLIDIKIPKRKRDELLLITNDNNILCVLGCEISENVKYDNTTKLYLIVKKLS